MPKYHIETLERRATRVVYEFNAPDLAIAACMVKDGNADDVSHETLDDEPTVVEIISAERIDGDPLPTPKQPPRPHQELKRMGSDLSQCELIRLVNVIQKFLWWDRDASVWNRDLPPSLDTLDFIADVLDRAGLRPAEVSNDNS
jgi:hypothetical protein